MAKKQTDWFQDEDFWASMFPFIFPEASFVDAAQNVDKIVKLAGLTGGSLLDLACGAGRYAVPFARRGFKVTGVDRSAFLLGKARELAKRDGANVEWIEEDMRRFVRPGAFDTVINVFTSFGYFEDEAENRRVLENVIASLKPGGTFVFDHLGKEVLAPKFQPARAESLEGGRLLVHRAKIVDDWSRIDDEWLFLDGERISKYRIRHWLYSGREIRDLLASVGFADITLYGTFDGAPYDTQAQRLIAVAKKPGG
jgi:SAM-dependent methyltransferase